MVSEGSRSNPVVTPLISTKGRERIAITGTNGFPGNALLSWMDEEIAKGQGPLADQFEGIIALDIIPPEKKVHHTRFYKMDFTQTGSDQKIAEIFAKENVTMLVHLAFQFNPRKQSMNSHELNSIGTLYLLNACTQQNLRKIIFQSTTHCYGAFADNPNFLSETHALRGEEMSSMIRDQVDVEKQARAYQQAHPDCRITILRPCSILGSNVNNFASRYLCRPACLTALGYDPLIQLVHEKDVLRAFQMVIEKDHPGVFNIVGEGVLPLLTILRLAGRLVIPIASTLLYPVVQTLWQANIAVVPPGYLDFLKYLWVADGEKAREEMGFEPQYSTRETVLSFAGMQRLKNINLH